MMCNFLWMQHYLLSIQTSSYASKHKHKQKKNKIKTTKAGHKGPTFGSNKLFSLSFSLEIFASHKLTKLKKNLVFTFGPLNLYIYIFTVITLLFLIFFYPFFFVSLFTLQP